MVKVKEDLTGWVMAEHGVPNSRWTVIKQADDYIAPNGTHYEKWLCECSCGKHTQRAIRGCDLKNGKSLSCGCIHKETMNILNKIIRRRHNKYSEKLQDEYGEYYIIYSNPDERVCGCFDAEHIEVIQQHSWHEVKGYLVTSIDGKHIRMHQLLFGDWYDHKDGDRLNNRQHNIRPCNRFQNAQNCRNKPVGKSGYRGVRVTPSGKYVAQISITVDGNQRKLNGKYRVTAEEAYIDYLKLAAKYHKEWSSVADDFKKYNIITKQNDSTEETYNDE